MSLGLLGRKVGMTRLFSDDGDAVPVTVVDVSNNRISQVKTVETDGYSAIQVTYGKRRPIRVTKAMAGHFAKAGVEGGSVIQEFRLSAEQAASFKAGAQVGVDVFKEGQMVDVAGHTQGKGFAGVIRRHHFSSNRATHGNSVTTNAVGSTGQRQDPGRVFPGKKMPGHLGAVNRTVQNLKIMRIDTQRQLLMIKGALPGSRGGNVVVLPAARGGA